MWPAFEQALTRHRELESLLGDPAVIADRVRYTKLAKEHGALQKMIKPYVEFLAVTKEIDQAKAMLQGPKPTPTCRRCRGRAQVACTSAKRLCAGKLEDHLLMGGEDFGSIIMEIRAGTGGDEAAIFAGDLYRMYPQYARDHGWKIEDISFSPGEQGGYKEIIFSITGDDAFSTSNTKAAAIASSASPKTETQGRIHTSAATVAVLPEPDEVQIEITRSRHRMGTHARGGAGGQHVNKTESRRPHLVQKRHPRRDGSQVPGRTQPNQELRPRHGVLRSRLFERQHEKLHQARADARKTLIGSGDRGERIRTYNFPQNRVTDHRINESWYKLDAIVAGNIGEVIDALKAFDKKQRLEGSGGANVPSANDN